MNGLVVEDRERLNRILIDGIIRLGYPVESDDRSVLDRREEILGVSIYWDESPIERVLFASDEDVTGPMKILECKILTEELGQVTWRFNGDISDLILLVVTLKES